MTRSLRSSLSYQSDSAVARRVQLWSARLDDALVMRCALIATMALAAFLRLWQLDGLGYNSDEAVYAGQGAAIAQDPVLKEFFPVFRAHPLLFQFTVALSFLAFGVDDLVGRLVAVSFGLACVGLTYAVGKSLYGRTAGLVAMLFMALMPYHVVVSRQVLLDGPMVLFATLTLYLLGRFAQDEQPRWLYAAGASMGLTFLAKETGIVLLGAVYVFLALESRIGVRVRDLARSLLIMALVIAPFPLSLALAGGSKTGQNYLVWQLFRRPNHDPSFYLTVVPPALGILLVAAALLGLWFLRRERTWRETLLVAWIVVPVVFFQLWPTKGFQYLLPTAPAFAVLAANAVTRNGWWRDARWRNLRFRASWARPLIAGLIALSLFVASWLQVQVLVSDTFTAGTGGLPGGREVGAWINANVPLGARFATIGPSMANVVMFYGHRRAYGLSVSPNPLRRNPSYVPIPNPDGQLGAAELQYLVWDSYSAARTPFFADKMLKYAGKYNGRIVHVQSLVVAAPDGSAVERPVIIIYEVRPRDTTNPDTQSPGTSS